MALSGIVTLIIVIIVALLALRFLFGILRVVVIVGLGILALALLYLLLTGNDVLGIGPTVSAVISTSGDSFDIVTGYVSGTVTAINQTASVAKKLDGFLPKAQESP